MAVKVGSKLKKKFHGKEALGAVHILRQPPEGGAGVRQMLTIADEGGRGVSLMLIIADEERRGSHLKADDC